LSHAKLFVIPAKAGIQQSLCFPVTFPHGNIAPVLFWKFVVTFSAVLDSRLRGNDDGVVICAK